MLTIRAQRLSILSQKVQSCLIWHNILTADRIMEDVDVCYDPLNSIEIFDINSIHHHVEMARIQQQYINQNENGEEIDSMMERNKSMFTSLFDC